MPRPLALHESLESFQEVLREQIKRPVLICGAQSESGTHFRLPGEDQYQYRSKLWRFLSRYTSGPCVRRENNDYYFDMAPTQSLRIVFPILEGENRSSFKGVALDVLLPEHQVPCQEDAEEVVVNGLAPYIHNFRGGYRNKENLRGLRFLVSEPFQTPLEVRPHWNVSGLVNKDDPNQFHVVSPPGQYAFNTASLTEFNQYAVCTRPPGPCTVCRGASGEHRHFGIAKTEQGISWPSALICQGCFPEFSKQIQALLSGAVSTASIPE